MKVRVMKRYTKGSPEPYYEVDAWIRLLGPIGYWATQTRTIDFDYAVSVFDDYKHNRRGSYRKDETVLIHYDDHRGDYSP